MLDVDRRTFAGAVEVDDVERFGALLDPAPGRIERVGVEDGLALVVAAQQAHRLAAADIHRGIQDHAGTEAQMPLKLASSASPAALDFSG